MKTIVLLATIFIGTSVLAQSPVSNFTASPLSGCSPLVVVFQDQSTGSPTVWAWDFGNGNTSTLQNPTATYFTPGTYTVTLTVTNPNGSNTLTRSQYITVYEPPSIDFSADNNSGCFPLKVQFSDLSLPGSGNTNLNWDWDFGNGTTSALQNPLTTYNTAGLFSVTLKITNDRGCTKTFSRANYIAVTSGVTAAFTHTQPLICNAPATISFTNTTTGPPVLSYSWDFGDGNFSTATNPVHTYTGNGSFTVILTATSTSGCEDTVHSEPIIVGVNTTFTAINPVCGNDAVVFTNTSSPTPTSATWTFGDGGTATGVNTTHSYASPGIYNVWLYNSYGSCLDSISQSITVNPKPTADFSAPVIAACQPPLTVDFTDNSTGGISGWHWDFGDGNTSTLQNPTHIYTSLGSFTVTLVVTNSLGCTDSLVKSGYISVQRPKIALPGFPKQGCIPFTISPVPSIPTTEPISSYQWDFGDGNTSTLANPVHTYAVQGTYTIKLIIVTLTGCTDTLIIPDAIKVGSKPLTNFTGAPTPVCSRQAVNFTDLTAPADEWHWNFGDGGVSSLQNPSHNYSDTGYFKVTLIALNNGCPDTLVRNNYIYVLPPIAKFKSTNFCNNRHQVKFTDQSIGPLTWDWDFGDGTTSNVQSPVHNFSVFGTYNVRLIVTNGGCADTTTKTVHAVQENPDFVADTFACRGTGVTFHASNMNFVNLVSYSWTFGDGGTSIVAVPDVVHTYANSGTYTVKLVVTDINGCKDSLTKIDYIRVNGPVAGFSATNLNGCTGLLTTFHDLSVPDPINAITDWKWDFGDGIVQNFSAAPFQHVYAIADTFSVNLKITDAAGCTDSIKILNLVITTDPIPDFVSADTLTCPGATVTFNNTSSPSGFTSLWNFGDGSTAATASPTHVFVSTGLYDIKLKIQDTNGCADSITKTTYIRVDLPRASFTVSDSVSSCIPLQIQFTNTSSFYSSILWDFGPGQGTSTLNDPVHYYTAPGSYRVRLLITSPGGCMDSAFKTIRVSDTIGSRIDYLPVGGCKSLQVSLAAFTTGPMASYLWDFGDGYIQTTTTPTVNHLYSSFGNFLPKVILQDMSGCLIPVQGRDTVYVTGANSKFGFDKNVFCGIGPVHFTDSTTFNDPVASYNWSFGDGGTSTLQNPVHQYAAIGNYTVRLIVKTQIGCLDTLTKLNIIEVLPKPLIDIAGDSIICINSSLAHKGIFLQPDTSVVTWSWNFPNGATSTQQNPAKQTYTVAGIHTITAIAVNSSGCKDTTTQTIDVKPLPVVTLPGQITVQTGFPVTIPATYSPNTVSWIWSPSAGLSCANCPTPEAGPSFDTRYQVYFTDVFGCTNIGATSVIVICKNANLFVPNTFSPNADGSNDIFYPRGKGLERVKLMRVFDRWGEVVFEKRDFPINDAASGWNGTFKGKSAQADVYVYQVEVFCDNGEIIRLNGNIALIL